MGKAAIPNPPQIPEVIGREHKEDLMKEIRTVSTEMSFI